jgi:hypothetical protein
MFSKDFLGPWLRDQIVLDLDQVMSNEFWEGLEENSKVLCILV